MDYIKDPAAIYEASFAAIRKEVDLSTLPAAIEPVAVRIIHACGMVDIAEDLRFSDDVSQKAERALNSGAPIFTDCEMVKSAIIQRFLPAGNEVICTLNREETPRLAREMKTTRSAAAVSLWGEMLEGAVVVIGNAPTTLFALLESIDQGGPRPAAILGFPVGFVGAAESKQELADNPRRTAFATLLGRRGGSAIAAASLNAISLIAQERLAA